MRQIILTLIAVLALISPMIGCLIGLRNYRRHGKEIKEAMEQEAKQAQEKGGIESLYYKRTDKRVFKRTFGIPMCVGFLVGLVLLYIVFHLC